MFKRIYQKNIDLSKNIGISLPPLPLICMYPSLKHCIRFETAPSTLISRYAHTARTVARTAARTSVASDVRLTFCPPMRCVYVRVCFFVVVAALARFPLLLFLLLPVPPARKSLSALARSWRRREKRQPAITHPPSENNCKNQFCLSRKCSVLFFASRFFFFFSFPFSCPSMYDA